MKTNIHPAVAAAIRAVESVYPPDVKDPHQDPRLLAYRQIQELCDNAVKAAQLAEHQANQSKLRAMAALAEVKVRVELLEEELGIARAEDQEPAGDLLEERKEQMGEVIAAGGRR